MYKIVITYSLIGISTPFALFAQIDSVELKTVEVVGRKNTSEIITVPVSEVSGKELDKTRGLTLGETLKTIPGVNSVQTGPTVSKPVIHGLYGNRILILNNGVRMEGQQWGSDHAPEIDPFVAKKISVIKGPASIAYGSDAMGGVVLVDPAPLPSESGMKGELNLVGMSNNKMGIVSGMVEGAFGKKLKGLSWRTQGTIRRGGNSKTAHYYMDNTGLKEENFSGAMGYKKNRFGAEVFFSEFYTKLGIFSGSSVGSISDLIAAINRSEPLSPSVFSYSIQRPFQEANHSLLKTKLYYHTSENSQLEFLYARQQNVRKEYDYLPYTGITTPQLYLSIVSHSVDLSWQHQITKAFSGKIGFNGMIQNNTRKYEYLIPDYKNYRSGIFILEKWRRKKLLVEAGIRYDYRWMQASLIDNSSAKIVPQTSVYNNFTGSLGTGYNFTEKISFLVNLGTAWRPPSVNELYSQGVHQSAASYEKGTPGLKAEQSYTLSGSWKYEGEKLRGELNLYNNLINHYIYLKPNLSFVHTSRGAYPSFTYTAANAIFRGIDISIRYSLSKPLSLFSKASLIWAKNLSIHDYLIYTPANRFETGIKYEFEKLLKLEKFYFSLSDLYVAHQSRVPANSDYAPPPKAYNLVALEVGFDLPFGKEKISINISATNLFNAAYRDYLNRFRYFSDDVGRNISLRLKVPFTLLSKNKS
jgi:iron complex outermembrane receptor protein